MIIVNYESWPDVLRLVKTLRVEPEFTSGRCQIVVVDNASRGPIPEAFSSPAGRHPAGSVARTMAASPPASTPAGESRRAPGCWSSIPMWRSRVDSWARSSRGSNVHEADPNGPPGIVGFGLRNPDGSPQGSVGCLSQPRPDHLGAVHTALAAEIPARLANSPGPGRLGHRRVHARQHRR